MSSRFLMTASIAVADLLYKRSNKRSKRSHRWSPPRSPASCTTPKWAFCARVLAGSQKIWKTPSVHFILWKTLGKENCGFITWLCVIPKMAKSTFNFLQVKTQRLIAITDFCWEFTLVFQNFSDSSQNSDLTGQYSIPVKNSPETTQISGAIWPGASAKPPVGCIRASKGGDFRPTPKMSGRLELNHPNIHREKSVDWKNVWKMLKDVVQPFLNKSVQAHPNHQVSPAWLFLKHCLWQVAPASSRETYCRKPDLWHLAGIFGFEDLKLFSCHISETLGQVSTGTLLWKPTTNHHRPSIFCCSIGANTWVLHLCSGIPDLEPIKTVWFFAVNSDQRSPPARDLFGGDQCALLRRFRRLLWATAM